MFDIDKNIRSAWKGHRVFASWLVQTVNPSVIVDLGVDYGYSTICFALPSIGTVYGVDNFIGTTDSGIKNTQPDVMRAIALAGLTNIEIIKGNFDDVAKTWDKKIDILHIDGLHYYSCVKNDFDTWSPFLSENGVVLFHDVISFAGIRKFWDEVSGNKYLFQHSAGLGVLSKDKSIIDKIKVKYG